jgi:adenylate cyclase
MEHRHDHQLVKRIVMLVEQNKDLKMELRELREKYSELMTKHEEYELILSKHPNIRDIREVLKTDTAVLQKFNMATVLYADIYGFSEIVTEKGNTETIDQYDNLILQFDHITRNFPIVKIHTIGDSFMCAGGIPQKNITNPIEVVLAGFQMLQLVKKQAQISKQQWNIRLAVHTGPVTASINGKTKVNYDIKGDTVNIASRMESAGPKGSLMVSVMTYELIKEFFDCEYFGKLPVKYKGLLDVYTVTGIKPELSVNDLGIEPNRLFETRFGLIRFHDIQEEVFDILEKGLSTDLFYHNLKHTVDVTTEAELIGWAEGVTDEDMLVLKTAALFHDVGHIVAYDNHEFHSCEIARNILPKYAYTSQEIELVCQIIMATKLPPQPKNILEEIICDSDLDYLGRIDFIPVSNTLYEELKVRNKIGTLKEWNKLQLQFISKHQYFTQTARRLREVNKQIQIDRIRQLIEGE